MLRHSARSTSLLFGIVAVLGAALVAAQSPIAAMYGDDQLRNKALTLGFVTGEIPATAGVSFPAAVYLTQGRGFAPATTTPAGMPALTFRSPT